jgi:SAM-dependent methyltransferase
VNVDFAKVADDYDRYRPGYPKRLQQTLIAQGLIGTGMRLLEVGCGTGQFTQLLVESGADVTVIDKSSRMIDLTKRNLRSRLGVEKFICNEFIKFFPNEIEYASIFFAQSWHLLDSANRAHVAHNSLKCGGRVCLVYNSRLEEAAGIVSVTNALIRKHNPKWVHDGQAGIYPEFVFEITEAGFANVETFSFDWLISYSFETWRGRILASKGVGASMPTAALKLFLSDFDREIVPLFHKCETIPVKHRIFCVTATK